MYIYAIFTSVSTTKHTEAGKNDCRVNGTACKPAV